MNGVEFEIEITPRALKDLRKIDNSNATRILSKIEVLASGLSGNVKRLTDFEPGYRLRVGEYRVLFDVDGKRVIVHRVKHRREAY